MCARFLFQTIERELALAAQQKQTGVSLSTLLAFGTEALGSNLTQALNTSAHFLKRELPIRFAHRALELDSLPHGLSQMPGIQKISEWYKISFQELRSFPTLRTMEDEKAFAKLLEAIYERHNPTIVSVAKGIFEFRKKLGIPYGEPLPHQIEEDITQFLDVFFTSRVGIRTLIQQQ